MKNASKTAVALLALASAMLPGAPLKAAESGFSMETNQQLIEKWNRKQSVDVNDHLTVFAHIFEKLDDEVHVYPTENYFYFSFFDRGVKYAGNIRLDALDRDKGLAHFAYFTAYTRWNEELVSKYHQMTAKEGLKIEKLTPLRYRLTFREKSVIFQLNDLSDVTPPGGLLRADEKYIGPVYDESGLQFFLVYNSKIKQFHYILNRTGSTPDIFTPSRSSDQVLIGTRTGFAFFKDRFIDRLILIGVFEGNSMVNNYYDGPFDQLPDNFLKGDDLRNALVDQTPELKGKIDRWGNSDKGASRVVIAPYIHYRADYELSLYYDCANAAGEDRNAYYACMKQEEPPREGSPTPENLSEGESTSLLPAKLVQEVLKDLGYDPGEPGDEWTEKALGALNQFREKSGLKPVTSYEETSDELMKSLPE